MNKFNRIAKKLKTIKITSYQRLDDYVIDFYNKCN